ncbi:15474_t:CDS:2, partial [Acaulospora colombiana]
PSKGMGSKATSRGKPSLHLLYHSPIIRFPSLFCYRTNRRPVNKHLEDGYPASSVDNHVTLSPSNVLRLTSVVKLFKSVERYGDRIGVWVDELLWLGVGVDRGGPRSSQLDGLDGAGVLRGVVEVGGPWVGGEERNGELGGESSRGSATDEERDVIGVKSVLARQTERCVLPPDLQYNQYHHCHVTRAFFLMDLIENNKLVPNDNKTTSSE